jgi:single-stranded-DNA-specific exonuclease
MLKESIDKAIDIIDKLSKERKIKIISHIDTDGVTSAAIFSRALQRWDKKFSLEITKILDPEFIQNLPKDHLLIFLDLASGSLDHLSNLQNQIIILDHHEITQKIPPNVLMINPFLEREDNISGSAICYLFAKTLSPRNKDLSTLSVIGMVGDMHEKNLSKIYAEILTDSQTIVKKGLLLYPSTRPLDKTIEYSSTPYIPGATGSYPGALELLRDAKIPKINNKFKSLYELNEEEMSNLITAIMLRGIKEKELRELIGNLYLVKFFNKLEDAREISAQIKACSRMNRPHLSLGFCLGNSFFKQKGEKLYINYKQHLIQALKQVSEIEKISGKQYTIINAKDRIKDTIIGTVASIISQSAVYEKGTIIIALAYNGDKVKVSARISGNGNRNVREILREIVVPLGGEVEGHPTTAGCLISKESEEKFISELQRKLDIDLIKI